jgi:hypothetical protein
MGPHFLPLHSFPRLARTSSVCLVALASLPACTLDESNGPRRSNSTGTTSSDPSGTGAGKTTGGPASGAGGSATGNGGTSTGGAGPGTTGTAIGTGSTATGTGAGTTTTTGSTGAGTSGTTTGSGGSGTGAGGTGTGGSGGGAGGAGPGTGTAGAGPGTAGAGGGTADASRPPGTPPGAEKILGIEFMQRVAGKWTGTNQSGPLGTAFPMTVEFVPNGASFMYSKLQLDPQNTVVWGFNVETYGGKDVLAYRNGGYLGGAKRDSRLQLVEYDAAKATYRFCAVKEQGILVDGCNYIEARYTFTAPDKMLFVVTTRAGKPHVHWDATRIETRPLPDPFPASIVSQGQGEAPWPPGAGL